MFKKLLLVVLIALFGLSTASAQFNKAELNFLKTPFKMQMNGDAVVGVRVDGKANTYGLPSVKDFIAKFKSQDKSPSAVTVTLVDVGARSIYDLCSNASPVQVWQDPNTPNNIHAVFISSPAGDPSFAVRLAKYYFSSNKGATWFFVADVPNVRCGFPTISGFSDGSALIANHNADGGGAVRGQAYKDAAAGLGSFTRLDAPGNVGPYIWPRVLATNNTSLANKFVFIGSINGSDTTRLNTCTNFNSTPGTWLGWSTFPSDQAETYALGRGTDGRIGIAYKNNDGTQPFDYADLWFIESTNHGTSFGAPLKIFDASFATDSLGPLRGVSIVYKGNAPAVAFETVKQTETGSFFPGAPAKIRFWSNTLPGIDPNRSVVVADTGRVGYHPYGGVNDVMASLCRPNIGVSSDGSVLFCAFSVPSIYVGGSADTTSFMDIWFSSSTNGGSTWQQPEKINPVSPIKDWRYPSISPVNDMIGSNYYCNLVALRGNIPGSYVNGVGNGESLEEYWSIRVSLSGLPLPIAPTLISPLNSSTGVSLTPLIDWSDVAGATSYNLQISTNSGFTTTVVNLSSLTSSQYQIPSGLLSQSTTYYWRASSTNSNGTGSWASPWSFTTLGPPIAPTLITPTNGSSILTLTPLLDWADVAGATTYNLQVSTNIGFTTTIVNLSSLATSQYQIPSGTLIASTVYYWRASATNTNGTSAWCTPWNFTSPSAPIAPTLITPSNGSNILTTTPILDWGDVSGATTYSLQVSTNSGFTTTLVNVSSLTASQYQVPSGTLVPSTVYYWRANASNSIGTGNWSSVWNFSPLPTGISQYSLEIPKEFKLYNNYPNPFNPTSKIRFDIPKNSNVKISVYDISGRIINQPVNARLNAGRYEISWSADYLASGVYFYCIETEGFTDVKRMLLVK